ncbi:LysM peptidoglycan-binding domain-containing protein [Corallincola spongiicola]|uniref:LysM peptidoglycan-binding domain-containing protein n=1 Tax=Corallincola spongiicola TaxID=2520508 RepID=A0ABY1WV01_9GAMM|nr:LysM peptidoglycan-binding domain-containing protein [Corallincola spongiicola]TAA48555.1 LysM peptidoglycan-binding domain-containing protein [Corallincola spongiicola]
MAQEYIVKNGDTLWDISAKLLGSPFEWPRLWRHNNRRDVISKTGRAIRNPDLIYPGQKLLIPTLSTSTPKPLIDKGMQRRQPDKPLSEILPTIKAPISLSYKLDDIQQAPIILPNAIVEAKLKGTVSLSSIESFPVNYVVNKKQVEAKITEQANHAFGSLMSETKLAFDSSKNSLTLGSKLVSRSTTPNVPTTAVGIELSSDSPVPKLQFEITFPQLKGTINQFHYLAQKVTFVLEVTPRTDGSDRGTDNRHSPQHAPVNGNQWDKIFAIGLFTAATVVVVATVIEDYLTLGAGVADDPASFALAAGMSARGAVLWSSTQMVAQRVVLPAMVRLTTSVVPAATLRYAH